MFLERAKGLLKTLALVKKSKGISATTFFLLVILIFVSFIISPIEENERSHF